MKALIFAGVENVRLETVPDPKIDNPGDAIVRVRRAGICGSDLHIYHGRESGLDPGTVMGHEFTGEIVETGAAVANIRQGDLVCSPFTINCGDCFYCRKGLTARCLDGKTFFGWVQNGKGLQGSQAEFVRVPLADSTLMKLPKGMTWDEALLLGDNFSTGYFCADMAEVKPDETYAVVGCGAVGLSAIVAAREKGARQLLAVDKVRRRLQLAEEMGASTTATPDDAVKIVRHLSHQRGADAVLEAAGAPSAQQLAIQLLRPGGTLAVVGMHTAKEFAFSPFDAYNLNLTYKTGRCSARFYMERLAPVIEENREKLRRLISHRLKLEDGAEGYRMFSQRADDCVKVVLDPCRSGE